MKCIALGEAKAAVAVGAAVKMDTTPFMERQSGVVSIEVSPNFNGTYVVEGSDDGVNYSALLTVTGVSQPNKKTEVQMKAYMRDNMTAWVAGSASSYLMADN